MKVIIVVILYWLVGFIEGKILLKNNEVKELIIYGTMMGFSMILASLLILGVKVASPAKFIEKIVFVFIK
ncbi:hypothetical protein [Clostridium grantii]|uniref:Uncharacterized protein n=1 Tax=Clostridium grantii DSM 8605 TaxID=1121316 RepID=A0A1M5QHY6_9CLOT|nr:hypothetical protein [Clostridium grantii]SHH13737.1 hypothetical protein SAMN02745207_00112 [Clostridium grantii DSM 8605]